MKRITRLACGLILGLVLVIALNAAPGGDLARAQRETVLPDETANATDAREDQGLQLPTEAVLTIAYCAESMGQYKPCPS